VCYNKNVGLIAKLLALKTVAQNETLHDAARLSKKRNVKEPRTPPRRDMNSQLDARKHRDDVLVCGRIELLSSLLGSKRVFEFKVGHLLELVSLNKSKVQYGASTRQGWGVS